MTEGTLELHIEACDNGIDATRVEVVESSQAASQIFVASMFRIMLINGIVYYSLKVAFVVANLEVEFKLVFRRSILASRQSSWFFAFSCRIRFITFRADSCQDSVPWAYL